MTVLVVGEPAHRWTPGFLEFVGILALLTLSAYAVLVVVDDWRARRRMRARQAARRAEELRVQELERKARADAAAASAALARYRAAKDAAAQNAVVSGHIEIRPDIAGPIDRATAWRDVAALQPYEQKDFR